MVLKTLFINLLVVLVVLALLFLVLYLFRRYVYAFDSRVLGVILFIAGAILAIYLLLGHNFISK